MGNKPNNNKEKKDEIKQYYSLLSQSFRKHQNIINNYSLNTELSFHKNFLNDNNNRKLRTKTDWKTYLINFFRKRITKGNDFYSDIIDDMLKERFGFEKKYLSIMFFIDLDTTYNKNNNDIYYQNYLDEKEEIDYEDVLKKRLSRYSNLDTGANKRTRSIMNVPEEENKIQNPTFEKNKKRKQVINLVKIIKKQLEQEIHPINRVISIFEKHISSLIDNMKETYENDYSSSEELFLKNITNLNDSIIRNIQKFAKKIHTATKLFYSGVIHLDCFEEEKDELINVIMGILFSTGSLHEKIFDLFMIQYKKDIEDFKYKLEKRQTIKPKDLQIDDKFCLDENTRNLINELKEKYNSNNNDKEEDKGIFADLIYQSNKNLFNKAVKYDGYNSAINRLKNELPSTKSPYKKMMLIASLSTEINECIDFFWDGTDEIIPKVNYLEVNSDELLKIFIFIVVRSQLHELIIHRKIIQKFTFKLTQQSMIGYYNITLDAAISYVRESLLNDSEGNFNNSINNSFEIYNNIKMRNDKNAEEDNRLYDDDKEDEDELIIEQNGHELKENKKPKMDSFNISTGSEAKKGTKTKKGMFDFYQEK